MEVLIVLIVAAILTLGSMPGLRASLMNKRMDAAIAGLHTDLNRGRREAVAHNAQVVACPGDADTGCQTEPAWEAGWLLFVDQNQDREWQSAEPLLRSGNALEQITVRSANTRRRLRFSPAGAAPASNASIVFCDRRGLEHGQKLVLSNTGRLRRAALDAADAARCPA